MGAVQNMLTTFNLPNYVGELFNVTPNDTPFLSAIGGLSGGKYTTSVEFAWQIVDNAEPGQNTALEGADPTPSGRDRAQVTNVVQIHQEAVKVSYTKQAATGMIAGSSILGTQPVQDEIEFQVRLKLEKIARDIEYSFIRGTYQKPADNTAPRKTRGILQAIQTNVIDAQGEDLSKDMVDALLREMFTNGAPFRNVVFMANAYQKQKLSSIYGKAPDSRNVGGVNIEQIETDFGRIGVMLNRYMPADGLSVIDLSVCAPVFLLIPGKGFLFREPLAKTGAYEIEQIYGEIGLEYGPESWHGKITGLKYE